jgi:hypothetical protein
VQIPKSATLTEVVDTDLETGKGEKEGNQREHIIEYRKEKDNYPSKENAGSSTSMNL